MSKYAPTRLKPVFLCQRFLFASIMLMPTVAGRAPLKNLLFISSNSFSSEDSCAALKI